jgi:dipeptidyl aminopeptidase/acylaminoacyl peptidase
MRVWLWDRTTGQHRRASDLIVEGFVWRAIIEWLPDGQHVLVQAPVADAIRQDTTDAEPDVAHVAVYHTVPGDSVARARLFGRDVTLEAILAAQHASDLAIIDIRTGGVHRVVQNIRPSGYWIAPHGTAVAFTELDTSRTTERRTCALRLVPLPSGDIQTLVRGIPQATCLAVSWSPHGDVLSYAATNTRGGVDLYAVSPGDHAPRLLTRGTHVGLRLPREQGPQWLVEDSSIVMLGRDTVWHITLSGTMTALAASSDRELLEILGSGRTSVVWSPDREQSLYVLTRDSTTMRMGVARVNRSTGTITRSFEADQSVAVGSAADAVGPRVIFVAQSATASPDLWITDDAFTTQRRLTTLNPTLTSQTFGSSRIVHWRGLHGEALRGVLILPAPYDPHRQYPLIVSLYGGARPTTSLNVFGLAGTSVAGPLNLQLLATRGYAVLVPDAVYRPGGSLMFDLAASVLPGVNRVIELGIADPDRLGITGLSFGGYSALALATLTPRFRAVVVRSGFSDLSTYAAAVFQPDDGHSAGFVNAEQIEGMRATVWEQRARYVENSPFYYLDRLQGAVLLVHGTADYTVPLTLADQTFSALQRLGKTVEYARYEGENHGEESWNYADASDELQRILDWFDRYVGQDPHGRR